MNRGAPTVVILTLAVLAGHGLGSFFSLYQAVPSFDMLMHALGGAWLASVFAVRGPSHFPSFFRGLSLRRFMLHIIFLVLLAGTLWEIYEYGFALWAIARFGDLGFSQPLIDTLSDLLLDAAGAAIVALLLFREEREVA